jgi:hypothetical protein
VIRIFNLKGRGDFTFRGTIILGSPLSILTTTCLQLLEENKDSWSKHFPKWIKDLFDKVYDYTGNIDLFPIEQV